MSWIIRIGDFLLATYLFIASAAACLVLNTYLLLDLSPMLTPLVALVFFSTMLFYNFHKVSALFSGSSFSLSWALKQFNAFNTMTKISKVAAFIGILCSIWFVQTTTLFAFIPLAAITVTYSVPLIKIQGKKKRLREIFIVKITFLSIIWTFITVTLPLIDLHLSVTSANAILLFIERFLFIFAICIPFEIRDMEQEKQWNIITLPQRTGINGSKLIGILALIIFDLLAYFQFQNRLKLFFPLIISAFIAMVLVAFTYQRRNKYYFRIFVDGTMQLQFILVTLFYYC
jgi:4-hydroxybenzoate polyprenyltransferase